MTLPTGTISMSQVNTELGRSSTATISLNESAVRTLAGVASGTISMDNLRGKSAETVTIGDEFISSTRVASGTAVSTYTLSSTGDINQTVNTNTTDIGDWITPKSAAANYECFATLSSGTLSSGTTGSWLALTSSRSWTRNQSTNGTSTAVIVVQIRKTGTSTVLDTATITLEANREP